MDFAKLNRLIRYHRQNVFNETQGDAHFRALMRLKKSKTFAAYCQQNRDADLHRKSERLLSAYA